MRRFRVPRSLAAGRRLATATQTPTPPPAQDPLVQITTLPNQVRVTTEESPGHFHSVGVYLDAGSRYEPPRMSGVSHMLDRMAYKSTSIHSALETSAILDRTGIQLTCSSSREAMMYQSTHFPASLPLALSLISSSLLSPLLLQEEIAAQREAARYELREIHAKPELILPEIVHQAAYDGKTLGAPLLCPEERLDLITPGLMREYLRTWVRPERIVISGAGMKHQELVELADQYFGHMPYNSANAAPTQRVAIPASSSSATAPSLTARLSTAATSLFSPSTSSSLLPPPRETATYTGGTVFQHDPALPFTHLYLSFPGLPISHPSIYTLAVLQLLLGGGSSFSAGGPGKGMYSRCYTSILNRHHTVDSCASFHHIYTDAGLFGLSASCLPETVPQLPSILGTFLAHLMQPRNISHTELSRAKNQLKSSLAMSLESRAVQVEDLGRQVQVHGRRIGVPEMEERIDEVNRDDVERVAREVLSGEVTVVARGDVERLGDVKAILRRYGLGLGAAAERRRGWLFP